jgi:hypothetical protein
MLLQIFVLSITAAFMEDAMETLEALIHNV